MGGIMTRRFGMGGTAPNGDPYWANVAVLCGFEGSDGSTSFVDESSYARTMTANGNAQIDTAQFKFGSSSLLLDGTGDFVSTPHAAEFVIGAGEFTVEAHVRVPSGEHLGSWTIVSQWSATSTIASWAFYQNAGFLTFGFYDSGGTFRSQAANAPPNADTQTHFAASRDAAGKIRLFKNGVYVNGGTRNETIRTATTDLRIGADTGGTAYDLNGHIDEFRFTPGVCRYDSDSGFTPPAAAYPRS